MLERVESSVRAPVSDLEHEPTIDQLDLVGVAAAEIGPDDITPVAKVKTFNRRMVFAFRDSLLVTRPCHPIISPQQNLATFVL